MKSGPAPSEAAPQTDEMEARLLLAKPLGVLRLAAAFLIPAVLTGVGEGPGRQQAAPLRRRLRRERVSPSSKARVKAPPEHDKATILRTASRADLARQCSDGLQGRRPLCRRLRNLLKFSGPGLKPGFSFVFSVCCVAKTAGMGPRPKPKTNPSASPLRLRVSALAFHRISTAETAAPHRPGPSFPSESRRRGCRRHSGSSRGTLRG